MIIYSSVLKLKLNWKAETFVTPRLPWPRFIDNRTGPLGALGLRGSKMADFECRFHLMTSHENPLLLVSGLRKEKALVRLKGVSIKEE